MYSKISFLIIFLVLIISCSPKKQNKDFDNWVGMKLVMSQSSSPVENWTGQEIAKFEHRVIDFHKLEPLLSQFSEIDSTKTPIWFGNMLSVVELKNGDSLKLNLGFPSAIFRDIKSRKVYILENKGDAEKWMHIVFGDLILK